MIDSQLLSILRCPENHQPLRIAGAAELAQFNKRIAAGGVLNRGGHPVSEPIQGALVRQDERVFYPIRNEIPIMLAEEAIPVTP
jgi:uncharacterized protein YbaR (Trm112 family)